MSTNVFCLMGPTASGKTALACQLVQNFPFEIVSVDSAMIYRHMDIGTAKPSAEELSQAPHHLINILNPPETYSAAQFCQDTYKLIEAIKARGKIPLLVGGTMMYFNALQQGLSLLPEANDIIRQQLLEQAKQKGWEALHQQLMQVDPISASRIHANDTQRIQRALEVFLVTGQPLSQYWQEQRPNNPYSFINIALFPEERGWLHERIAQRFDVMLGQNFLDEVEQLLACWPLTETSPAMRCVGYRQAYEYLMGKNNYTSFREKGIAATRQLAKRQLTWLRHWDNVQYIACDKANCMRETVAIMEEILDNGAN